MKISPEWSVLPLIRLINNQKCKKILLSQLSLSSKNIKESAFVTCRRINDESPDFVEKTRAVIACCEVWKFKSVLQPDDRPLPDSGWVYWPRLNSPGLLTARDHLPNDRRDRFRSLHMLKFPVIHSTGMVAVPSWPVPINQAETVLLSGSVSQ